MKTVSLEDAALATCAKDAQADRVVVTRKGKPVAVIVGVKGWDMEDLRLCTDDHFWKMIVARRKQKTISRAELERRLARS